LLTAFALPSLAQVPIRGMPRMGGGGGMRAQGSSDSLQFEKRDFSQDSVTVIFRYLDTAKFSPLDTSISDFYRRVPLKPELVTLGNYGNAARRLLFSPLMKPGWDAGFHAFDPYAFSIWDTRFMNTTKPYTELTYMIGSKLEQQVGLLHTQNILPNWNFVFHYRLINSPGAYNSQNTNHSNFRFNSQFTTKDQRYNIFFIAMSNGLQSAENGGIESDTFVVNRNPAYSRDRFNIPTRLADSVFSSRNFFSVKLQTGNRHTEGKFLLRQQYDFGKKDSLVTDSTVTRYFLPRLRVEHTVQYNRYRYRYLDIQAGTDSLYYQQRYGIGRVPDSLRFDDRWKELSNDLSLIQFPDPKNPLQFLKAGITVRNISGEYLSSSQDFTDLMAHGEYRNRTRNRKWDMLLYGQFHFGGRFAGDYSVDAKVRTLLSKKIGSLELGFRNVNRTPSMIFLGNSSFPLADPGPLARENITQLSALLELPSIRTTLSGDYYLLSNYLYFSGFNRAKQSAALFNLLRLGISRQFRMGRHWRWYLDLYAQLTTPDAPVNLPLLFTRNRLAFEGRFFTNLNLSAGFDVRYMTPYKADDYSPALGQYFLQEDMQIAMLPDIAAYLNFRIRNFTAFTRLENLNTLTFRYGFGFKNANYAAPFYPTQDLHMRLGVFWTFVN
jgi:hypothetical protein